MICLSWGEFDQAVNELAALLPPANALYGLPRGGLCLAVALSHRTGLPVVDAPGPGVLLVDDIVDSGASLQEIRAVAGPLPAVVWVRRAGCDEPALASSVVPVSQWIVFPWERVENAQQDAADYAARELA